MLLFDSNPMHPLNQLSFECQKYILALTMVQFREFPLCSGSYNEEKIRFYDGVLGNLIRTRDTTIKYNKNPKLDVLKFACNWEYQGNIYRLLDKSYVYPRNRDSYRRAPQIKWHGMIASWSSSYDFTKGFNHINADERYTIIHANTKTSAGIDANKFGKYLGCYNPYTAGENEIIFPMNNQFIKKVYRNITPNEFITIMKEYNS